MRDLQKDWNVLYGIIDWIAIPKQQIVKEWLERAIKAEAENARLRKVVEAARRVMDAVMAQPQDVKERNIALAWLDAALWVVELDKEGE